MSISSYRDVRGDTLSLMSRTVSVVTPLPGDNGRGSEPERPNILLGVTGSVAAIKLPELVMTLSKFAEVKVVTTEHAKTFFTKEQLPGLVQVYMDEEDWQEWEQIGDPVLHIELRKWADLLVIAPLTANSLAKIANGMADNLLTCVARAWDYRGKPFLVAPAMNTMMWNNPYTGQQLASLRQLGVQVMPPVSKRLACGDVGQGGMAPPDAIAHACQVALGLHVGLLLKRERQLRRRFMPVSIFMLGLFTLVGVAFSSQQGSVLTDHPVARKVQRGVRGSLDRTRAFLQRRLQEKPSSSQIATITKEGPGPMAAAPANNPSL